MGRMELGSEGGSRRQKGRKRWSNKDCVNMPLHQEKTIMVDLQAADLAGQFLLHTMPDG